MTTFSNTTLNQLANALVDDSIQYILHNERFNKILNEAIINLPKIKEWHNNDVLKIVLKNRSLR